MPTVHINASVSIDTDGDETLLQAMERSGLAVEYQCRDGHCGACRCQLLEGEVEYTGVAMAYIQSGEILPCICRANSPSISLNDVHCQDTETQTVLPPQTVSAMTKSLAR